MEGLTEFDWTDLHTFLQASRNGTISKAAERLHIDVTTVRRRLAAFERAIGMKLFVKSGRSLQLTSAGQRIYSIASGMEELKQ